MRFSPLLLLTLLFLGVVAAFLLLRGGGQPTPGPALALCPGPDAYGYTCSDGTAFAYIDATNDTRLYQDDGVMTLSLPFSFTFYGQTYEAVRVSSNGNLQFTTANPDYFNRCLNVETVPELGALIAPYWDDLDLAFVGQIDTLVVGTEPARIFVVEWDDVPRFGEADDRVTFEVQLFEETNDIVFLYQSVETEFGSRGASATIGIQDAAAGVSLQYGCDQPSIADAGGLVFAHPLEPARLPEGQAEASAPAVALKAEAEQLRQAWSAQDAARLRAIRADGLSRQPARTSSQLQADLTGDGQAELVWLWQGGDLPARITIVSESAVLFDDWLGQRALPAARAVLAGVADLTGDGLPDVVAYDADGQGVWLLIWSGAGLDRHGVVTSCSGALHLDDGTSDGIVDAIRDGCAGNGRQIVSWQGDALTLHGP